MTRTILLAAALLMPGVALASPPHIEQLPACKSGWKPSADTSVANLRFIPRWYVARVSADSRSHATFDVIDADGHLLARVHKGQSVAFDCFDPPSGRCGPGETCT
jgi:hypothetical protein